MCISDLKPCPLVEAAMASINSYTHPHELHIARHWLQRLEQMCLEREKLLASKKTS